MSIMGMITGANRIELGVISEDDKVMNDEFGMYLQADEIMYLVYIYQNTSYGFTNKGLITKKPIANEPKSKRFSVKRYPFTQYFVTDTDIRQGKDEIDIEVLFALNLYKKEQAPSSEIKIDFELTVDKDYTDYAVIIYKMFALLQEKQKEQKALEEGMVDATKSVLARSSQVAATLEHELLITKEWFLRNVYTTQFANIHEMFKDAMKGFILHKNKESNGKLFDNIRQRFYSDEQPTNEQYHSKDNSKEDIIDVEAEVINEK